MKKYVVKFYGGEQFDYYEYVHVVEAKDSDELEFYLLEVKRTNDKSEFSTNMNFDHYAWYTLEEWITNNTINLKDFITK